MGHKSHICKYRLSFSLNFINVGKSRMNTQNGRLVWSFKSREKNWGERFE